MKKILKVVLGLFTVLLFAACNNGSNDADNLARILQIIENTPDAPIDRNVELTNITEQKIVKGTSYDFSSKEGKKAFLVVMNNNDYNTTVFRSNSSENSEAIEYDYKIENENGVFYNVPFNPPHVDLPAGYVHAFSLNQNSLHNTIPLETQLSINDTRNFYAATKDNKTNNQWASGCQLKAIGQHCYVWFKAKDGININDGKLQTLADTFDSIYEKETYIFGKNTLDTQTDSTKIDITDPDTKVHIIVYDLFDDLETTKQTRGGTFGYFWGLDFNNSTEVPEYDNDGNLLYNLYSNKCQCLHIDSYFLEIAEKSIQSTIAHEFQHLLHYVNKTLKYKESSGESGYRYSDTWFNEMMSMVCEDIMQTQIGLADSASPKSRLSNFNGSYNKGFLRWRNTSSDDPNDVYMSYANAYAFGAYLVRNYGIDFIKELAHNNEINKNAITAALDAVDAPEDTFDKAYDKFYNVVLNPKGSNYTLNKETSKTYNYTTGKSATFRCTAVNLYDYVTISSQYMRGDYVTSFYQASKLNDYKGPVILNNRIFNSLDESGMFVSYLGTVGTGDDQFNPTFRLTDRASSNSKVIYKIVFTD